MAWSYSRSVTMRRRVVRAVHFRVCIRRVRPDDPGYPAAQRGCEPEEGKHSKGAVSVVHAASPRGDWVIGPLRYIAQQVLCHGFKVFAAQGVARPPPVANGPGLFPSGYARAGSGAKGMKARRFRLSPIGDAVAEGDGVDPVTGKSP